MLDVLTDVAVQTGLGLLAAQLVLTALFSSPLLPAGPWKDEPGFTAHQAICFPFLLFCVCLGSHAWFREPSPTTAEGRVLGDNEAGWTLTQIMAGAMLFWDTPTGLAVASLREP